MGVEPGLSDVFARYVTDKLFSEVHEFGVGDGANLAVTDEDGNEIFAPSFSIWTTIEECLNPAVTWEGGRGWFTTKPSSEPEVFDFPEGMGVVWQTAVGPAALLECVANQAWGGLGALGPEAFDANPFLQLISAQEKFDGILAFKTVEAKTKMQKYDFYVKWPAARIRSLESRVQNHSCLLKIFSRKRHR